MIKIGIKGKDKGVYVGRPSILGNPYKMKTIYDRNEVCDKYEVWFEKHKDDDAIKQELDRLMDIYYHNDNKLILTCYCAPNRCHAETIKKYLEKRLENVQKSQKAMLEGE